MASCYVKGPLGLVLPCSQVCNSHTSANTTYMHGPDGLLMQQMPLTTYVHRRLPTCSTYTYTTACPPSHAQWYDSSTIAYCNMGAFTHTGYSLRAATKKPHPGEKPLHQGSAPSLMSQHSQPQRVPCTAVGKERRPLGHWQANARPCCDDSSARMRLE